MVSRRDHDLSNAVATYDAAQKKGNEGVCQRGSHEAVVVRINFDECTVVEPHELSFSRTSLLMVGGKERGDKTAEKLFEPASDLSGGAMSKKPNLDIGGRDSVPETMRRTNSLQQATSTASVRPAVSGERVLKQVRIWSHVEDLPKSLCSVFARYPTRF